MSFGETNRIRQLSDPAIAEDVLYGARLPQGTSASFNDSSMAVIYDKDKPDSIHLGTTTMSKVDNNRSYDDLIVDVDNEECMSAVKEQWNSLPRPDTPVASTPPMTAVDSENATFDEATGQKVMLRLIFSYEDGGMLIGKNGRHITKLKEMTSASWFITGNNPNNVDRIVVIRGTADEVTHAIHALALHMNEQTKHSTRHPTLRFLFPTKSIGAIIGPNGSHVEKKRNELGIVWLHAHQNSIPFTQERILEISGPTAALKTTVAWLVCTTISDLATLQQTSTLYMPTRNGLQQLLQKERRPATSEQNSAYRISAGESDSSYAHTGRKRSSSAFGVDTYKPTPNDAHLTSKRKRPRYASDGNNSRVHEVDRSKCLMNSRRRSSPMLLTSSSSSTSSNTGSRREKNAHTEKIIIPDTIAGPLIGRSGSNLESLRERSGANISISPRVHNMPDRIVTVAGKLHEVSCACKLIKGFMRNFDQPSP
ncbi:RNA binding protein, heterogenous nuclear RNP-K like protein [Coemansia sp. RSA 1365]|nr:RNA binding protein, heterogenous nuclear RNP-K like protein [Coemansia sp. RSA 1365]